MDEKPELTCPNCSAPVIEATEECPACLLHIEKLDGIAGTIPRHDSLVTDYQEAMSLAKSQRLAAYLAFLGQQFPQATFSVFFFPPNPKLSHRLYAFWLANRGRFSPMTARSEKNFSALLLVDCDRGKAVLNVGYGLERFLREQDLEVCLLAAQWWFDRRDYARGVRVCFGTLTKFMRAFAIKERAGPGQPEGEVAGEGAEWAY